MESQTKDLLQTTTFKDFVLTRQYQWKKLNTFEFKGFPEAFKVPEFMTRNLTKLVTDNLPDWIPNDSIESIYSSHPPPIIGMGLLTDSKELKEKVIFEYETPQWITVDEDKTAWKNGIKLLNEIATNYLVNQTMTNISKKNKLISPAVAISKLVRRLDPESVGGIKRLKRIFGNVEEYSNFNRKIALCTITGSRNHIDQFLNDHGYEDLDRLALEIGREFVYGVPEDINNLVNQRLLSILEGGMINLDFPRVINMRLALPLIGFLSLTATNLSLIKYLNNPNNSSLANFAVSALLSSLQVGLNFGQIFNLIHETMHYLSQDTDRFGLVRLKKVDQS